MTRNCIEIESNERIRLFVDEENAEEILSYCEQNDSYRKKYTYIKNAILRGVAVKNIYGKVQKTDNIYEIRFFPNVRGKNDRIYCKQYDVDRTVIVIVMAELYKGKKSQKIDKRIQSRIEGIKKFEYDIK